MRTNLLLLLGALVSALSLSACDASPTGEDTASPDASAAPRAIRTPMSGGAPGWSASWDALGGAGTALDPSIGSDGANLYAFYVDRPGTVNVSQASLSGGAFSPWQSLGDTSTGPVSVVNWGSTLAVFYRHTGDSHLHAIVHASGAWRAPLDLGGALETDPVGVLVGAPSNPPPGFDVAMPYFDVYGFLSNGTLTHISGLALWVWAQESDAWSSWSTVAGSPTSNTKDLSVVSPDGAAVDAVYIHLGKIAHGHQSASYAWTWDSPTTTATVARLSATSLGSNEVDVAWLDPSGNAYEKTNFTGAWFADAALGGDAFHLGSSARPRVTTYNSRLFYEQTTANYQLESALGIILEGVTWTPLPGGGCVPLGSNAAIAATAAGRVDLVAVGDDGALYHTWYGTSATSGGAQLPVCSCGAPGQACCGDGQATGTGCSTTASYCSTSNVCVACGGLNEPCCPNGGCSLGFACIDPSSPTGCVPDNPGALAITGYGHDSFESNQTGPVAFNASELQNAPVTPVNLAGLRYVDSQATPAAQKEVIVLGRDQAEYLATLSAIGNDDPKTCSYDEKTWDVNTVGPGEPPRTFLPPADRNLVTIPNAVGFAYPYPTLPAGQLFTTSFTTAELLPSGRFGSLPTERSGVVNGVYVLQHGVCSTEVDITSTFFGPLLQKLPNEIDQGINDATPTGLAQASPSVAALNLASFLEQQSDGTPGGGFVQELDMVVPFAWPPFATTAMVTRNYTYRFGLQDGILTANPSTNAQASCDTGFQSGAIALGIDEAVPQGVQSGIFLGALEQQSQPIPVLGGSGCSDSGPNPASCYQACRNISSDPTQWPPAPDAKHPDDSAWRDADFCGLAAHTILDVGVAAGADAAGLSASTQQLQQNLTGPLASDPSRLANVRCNFNPSYVKSDPSVFGGRPQPVCEYTVRARRVNVMPDKVELVWFDAPNLSSTPADGLSDEAFSVYLMAAGQGKGAKLCTRQPVTTIGAPISHPFAHMDAN